MPATRKRCEKRKTTSTGSTETTVARASVGSWTDWAPAELGLNAGVEASSEVRPTWIGYPSLEGSITKGRKKLFQLCTKLKKATSATIGAANGRATRVKAWNSLHPSIRAAASRSRGTLVRK